MWNFVIMSILVALTGFFSITNEESVEKSQGMIAVSMAESMNVYRQGVVSYFRTHVADVNVSIPNDVLISSGAMPAWASPPPDSGMPVWGNYRDATGAIYVFSKVLPKVKFAAEIVALAKNSVLAGIYPLNGATTLFSPLFGDTSIPLTALAGQGVPLGSPVWITLPL
jgi:hypothetical protein